MDLKNHVAFHGFSVTHPGLAEGREENQDQVLIVENRPHSSQKGNLYGVADGIGGESAGLAASYLSLKILSEIYYQSKEEGIPNSLLEAFKETNEKGWS